MKAGQAGGLVAVVCTVAEQVLEVIDQSQSSSDEAAETQSPSSQIELVSHLLEAQIPNLPASLRATLKKKLENALNPANSESEAKEQIEAIFEWARKISEKISDEYQLPVDPAPARTPSAPPLVVVRKSSERRIPPAELRSEPAPVHQSSSSRFGSAPRSAAAAEETAAKPEDPEGASIARAWRVSAGPPTLGGAFAAARAASSEPSSQSGLDENSENPRMSDSGILASSEPTSPRSSPSEPLGLRRPETKSLSRSGLGAAFGRAAEPVAQTASPEICPGPEEHRAEPAQAPPSPAKRSTRLLGRAFGSEEK